MAVLAVMFILLLYFEWKTPEQSVEPQPQVMASEVSADVSAYELFCQNNQDISCAGIVGDTQTGGQVILMATDEIDDDLREKISSVVLNGTSTELPSQEVTQLLDKLYEEDLPDDIIEPKEAEVSTDKVKVLNIVPARKPLYFGKNPLVVVVIDDMGISQKRTADIISLKYPLTAAFLTYGKNLTQQMQNSAAAGQEIMLHTPMEPFSKADVAPDVLTTKMSGEEIQNNLKAMLEKFPEIKGINNHMGSKLTEDYERMQAVMAVLKERGLFFLDSKTSPKSKAEKAAADVGIQYAHRHVFLDNNNDKAYVLGQLAKVEKLARKNGYVIAIGHPKIATYAALKEWLPQLEKKKLQLVHLSKVVEILHPHIDAE